MNTSAAKGEPKPARRPPPLYSKTEVDALRVRGKARALTQLCVACEDLGVCAFGRRLEQLYREYCEPQVGDDFKYCSTCSRTMDGSCGVDRAALAEDLHSQLAHCTRKRGFEMPFAILRWDVLLAV